MDKLDHIKKIKIDGFVNKYIEAMGIKNINKEAFWDWFQKESIFFQSKDVLWDSCNYLIDCESRYGYCHINSLKLSINNYLELYSGFVVQFYKDSINIDYLIHSFNADNHKVIDYTYFRNIDKFNSINLTHLFPFEYIGIKIPNKFISKVKKEIINPKNLLTPQDRFVPLFAPYFFYVTKMHDWKEWFNQIYGCE